MFCSLWKDIYLLKKFGTSHCLCTPQAEKIENGQEFYKWFLQMLQNLLDLLKKKDTKLLCNRFYGMQKTFYNQIIEQFSIKCCKTKTKPIIGTYQ